MKKQKQSAATYLAATASIFLIFVLFTAMLLNFDVKPVGPKGTAVGCATVNQAVHQFLGVNWFLYTVTDWLSIAAILVMLGFAVLGLIQLISRKSLWRVDSSILVLGGFYLLLLAAYCFFEYNIVNYRPVLIAGNLEASYPSSTTMLLMCVMPAAMLQFKRLIKNQQVRTIINTVLGVFTGAMVIGRLVSGVHWLTDIFGGLLLSTALVLLYYALVVLIETRQHSAEKAVEPVVRKAGEQKVMSPQV